MNRSRPVHRSLRGRGGFTLIELLLVLVIVATLAALVAPTFMGRSKDAKIKAARGQIGNFEVALKLFEQDYGRYPTTDEGLDALVSTPALADGKENDVVYLEKGVPKDPWGNPYQYASPGEKNSRFVDIYSLGPDGQDETGDEVGNWEAEADE